MNSDEPSQNVPLGLDGFTFADLHQPARLRDLYGRFIDQVKAVEPELWTQWEQYRDVPESLTPIARGNIVVAMAPHVSRFVAGYQCWPRRRIAGCLDARLRRRSVQNRLRPPQGSRC